MRFARFLVPAVLCLGTTIVLADSDSPRGNGALEKFTATPSAQDFVSTSMFHLFSSPPTLGDWEGCVLRVHVLDGTEISVLGGRISNAGHGTSGTGVLDGLPSISEQNATSTFLATAFNTGTGEIDMSHNCPATVTVHANNGAGENSDTDLDIQVYDIDRFVDVASGCSCSSYSFFTSDLILVPAGFVPTRATPLPPIPALPETGHFTHLLSTAANFCIGGGSCDGDVYYLAQRTGSQPVGLDHESSVPALTEWSLGILATLLLAGGSIVLLRANR